ncbi:PH domain-containing protein [Luteimonas pelagia]
MATTTDPGAPVPAPPDATAADRRLHPMSWLFVLIAQLRQFIVPLLALVFLGRGNSYEWWSLVGVAALAAYSAWQYVTYRYGVAGDALVVRQGVLERSVRVIPFARIHNVALQQSLLHRLFDVAEVRLESAGGKKPEAEMRVLRLGDALALERLVRSRGAVAATGDAAPAEDAGVPLLALTTAEVVKLGLVSNRGMILLAAAFGASWQVSPELLPDLFESWGQALFGWADARAFGPVEYVVAGASLALLFVAVLRLLSIALALLQYHGFTLREQGRRLTVERGLLQRWRTSASRRRIQAWTLREGVLHRLFARRSLEVDTAVSEEQQHEQRALREVAPIAPPAACDALVAHLLPRSGWGLLAWTPVGEQHWWRLWLPGVPFVLAATAALCWRFGPWGLLALGWLAWSAWTSRQHARRLAWSVNDALVAVRGGWWSRHWRFAELDKLQALQLRRSPLDRRCGTATLAFDTAGAGALAPPLQVRFLPVAEARTLHDRLAAELARRPLRW